MEIYEKSQKTNENQMKNKKSFENPENCTLIKHFIKALIRKIGPAFSGNPRKSGNPKIPQKFYGNL